MAKLSSRSTRTPLSTDIAYISDSAGTADGKVTLNDITVIPESTRTINVNNSMTAAQIQAEIDSIGKYIPDDQVITVQFADGTYTLDTALNISGFYGSGIIKLTGNDSDSTSLNTSQSVILDFTGNAVHGLQMNDNAAGVQALYFRILVDDGKRCVFINRGSNGNNAIYYSSLSSSGTSSGGAGIYISRFSCLEALTNYITGGQYGIAAFENSLLSSKNNDDISTQPSFGLRAANGAVIAKNGTQPDGSSANESIAGGSEIR